MMASATRPRSAKTEPIESPVSAVSPATSKPRRRSPAAAAERGQVLLQLPDAADRGRVERVGLLHHHEPGGAAGSGQHRVERRRRSPARWRGPGQARRARDLRDAGLARQFVLQPGQGRGLPGHARADDQDLGGGQDAGREAVGRGRAGPRRRRRRRSSLISASRADGVGAPGGAEQACRPAAAISSATGRAAANRPPARPASAALSGLAAAALPPLRPGAGASAGPAGE